MKIKDLSLSKLKLIKKLIKDLKKEKVFMIESPILIDIAVAQNLKPLFILVTEEFIKKNSDFLKRHSAIEGNFFKIENKRIKSLSSFSTHRGIIGFFKFRENHKFYKGRKEIIVALDGVQDPTNFGAILRSSLLFGVKKIITSKNTASIYNPKVVRGSMGAVFYIDVKEHIDIADEISNYKKNGYTIYISDSNKGTPLKKIKKTFPLLIAFGNESRGISEDVSNMGDLWVKIETTEVLNSLSVSTAASIILYEFFI